LVRRGLRSRRRDVAFGGPRRERRQEDDRGDEESGRVHHVSQGAAENPSAGLMVCFALSSGSSPLRCSAAFCMHSFCSVASIRLFASTTLRTPGARVSHSLSFPVSLGRTAKRSAPLATVVST